MACKHLHVVNNYSVTEGSTMATLSFVNPVTSFENKERVCIKLCTSIPETYNSYTTQILVNGSGMALYNKYGNPLTVSDLRKGIVYQGYYGSVNPHVSMNAPKNTGCNCG